MVFALVAPPTLASRASCVARTSRRKVARGFWLPHFLRAPPMRFGSAHTHLRNRLACMTTRDHSPSGHLCEIVPVKRPSMKVSLAMAGSLNRISHNAMPFFAFPPEGRSRRTAPPFPSVAKRFRLKARERIVGLPGKRSKGSRQDRGGKSVDYPTNDPCSSQWQASSLSC